MQCVGNAVPKVTVMHVVIVTSPIGFLTGKKLTVSSNCTVALQAGASDRQKTELRQD
jgi:hypothetical protein